MKPKRQGKHDRLTYGGGAVAKEEMAIDHAMAPFDRAARAADETWGTDRLIEMVSPETAVKFGEALAKMNEAISANDPEAVAFRAAVCVRGYAAMDAEARRLGHTPPSSGVIVYDLDGWVFGVLPDGRLWRQAEQEHPGLRVYTIREVGLLLRASEANVPLLDSIKSSFPGAEVVAIRKKREPLIDDEINF